jgi:hypothetical protein
MKNCKKTKKNLLKGGGWKKEETPTNTPQPTKSPRWTMPTPKKSPSNTKRKGYVEQLRMQQSKSNLPASTRPRPTSTISKTRKNATKQTNNFRNLLQSIENKLHTPSEAEIRRGISNKDTTKQLEKFMKTKQGVRISERDAYFATLTPSEKERFIRAQGQFRTVSIPSKVGQYSNSVNVSNSYAPNIPYSYRHPLSKGRVWVNHPNYVAS